MFTRFLCACFVVVCGTVLAGAQSPTRTEKPSVADGFVQVVVEDVVEVAPVPSASPSIIGRAVRALVPTGTKPAGAEEKKKDEEPVEEPKPQQPVNPREFKFNMQDGSVIAGEMTIDQVAVETAFGPLTVPVAKIRTIRPGLDSMTELAKKISGLIDNLGMDDYKGREQAHKDLTKMGVSVRKELEGRAKDDNAERRRHIQELLKELEQRDEDRDDEGPAGDPPLIRGDTVITTDFTIVGRVVTTKFNLTSKYGTLAVNLGDVRKVEKDAPGRESLRKAISVDGTNLAQLSFKSALRVEKGDRITVKADGQITMTPWGETQSTPDGGQNFGWYVPGQINGGSLIAKIGQGGKIFKVGSNKSFVADSTGTLMFAVAMQNEYAQQGYAFPGQYSVKVRVDPK